MMEVASAVRIPSPEPELPDPPRKRERSPFAPGPSKRSRFDRGDNGDVDDFPHDRRQDRRDDEPRRERENGHRPDGERTAPARRTDPTPADDDARLKLFQSAFSANRKLPIDDSKTRAGGAYIPPARLKAMQAAVTDKSSAEFQRMAWEALKKSIQGLINKCNVANIKQIVPELFTENLIRGRGLFCRSIMKAQAASLPFTNIYAAMVAIVNTKLPSVGDLLVRRLIIQFRKGFRRNDKAVAIASSTFLAHLVNVQVVHEVLIAEILLLLLNKPTDDSVEIAVQLMRESGQFLEEMSGAITNTIFDQFRNILHEADLEKRTQYMIEVLFQVRKDKYKDNPAVREDLDLVEEEDQVTHRPSLQDDIKTEDGLNIFKFDPEYEEHEEQYRKLKAEILGEEEGSDEDGYTDASSDDEEDEEEKAMEVKDQTNADLVNLRRTIYLTIKSSGGFEECCHKLMRINLPHGMENELTSMIVECASQERTYEKFYGQIGERFCKLNRMWADLFQDGFVQYYETIHRFETNRLRIIAQFFSHLLATDAIGWFVLHAIKLNEEDTTSSSRIFIKILFEELMSNLGQKVVVERLKDPMLEEDLTGIFPTDDQTKTRVCANFSRIMHRSRLHCRCRRAIQTPTASHHTRRTPHDRALDLELQYASVVIHVRAHEDGPIHDRPLHDGAGPAATPLRQAPDRDRLHQGSDGTRPVHHALQLRERAATLPARLVLRLVTEDDYQAIRNLPILGSDLLPANRARHLLKEGYVLRVTRGRPCGRGLAPLATHDHHRQDAKDAAIQTRYL